MTASPPSRITSFPRDQRALWLTLAALSELGEPQARWIRRLIANIRSELDARQRAG